MIAILIDHLKDPSQEVYFKKFSDLILTTNQDFKYFDSKILNDKNSLEKFCSQNKIDGILKVNASESIKHFSLDDFEVKTNFVCVSDGKWIKKQKRFFFKMQNLKKSLEHLGVAIFLAPSMVELWCAWADILLDNKFYEKSLAIYKNAMIVKQKRDIFDTQPIWIDRNEDYAKKMYDSVKKTISNIKIVISTDQNNSSSSFTTTVT